ncbi:hypothetical protein WN944_022896 [Citrus x changshan-huyou]|uniref:Uncharacterized protein n=1 Tax=Citrus x changshan-huyou TaxID=2935761 RepID=A0AAP0MZ68_9ROSI
MMMDDDMENGGLGPYQDRPRTFPNMRSKPYVPKGCLSRTMGHNLFHRALMCHQSGETANDFGAVLHK